MDDTQHSTLKKRFWSGSKLLVLFVLVFIGGVAGYARYSFLQHSGTQQVYDNLSVFGVRLQNIESTIALHEKRITDIEDKLSKTPAPSAVSASPVASPPTSSAVPAPIDSGAQERIAQLEKDVAMLKNSPSASHPQNSEQILQAIHLLSTFHHFSNKVIGGKPFAIELSALNDELGRDESVEKIITPLLPYADTGIPTFATLLASFDQSLDQLGVVEATPPPGLSVWERFVFNLEHLVRIRKLDELQSGNSVDAIVGRAQAHLDSEEIEAAVAEIKQLPDNARGSFNAWLEDAQIATATPGIIDNLEEKVMQKSFNAEPTAPVKP